MRNYIYSIMTDQAVGWSAPIGRTLFLGCSYLYGFGARLVRSFYRIGVLKRVFLPKPVISVGNITVGGVGKTPLVQIIAKFLREKKKLPAVLIRGYMAHNDGKDQEGSVESDEALLLSASLSNVPIAVNKNRAEGAKCLLENHSVDVFLMDDGFQHHRIKRDLDVVAINASNPFGNERVIPRGILREPLDALRKADMIVITKADIGKGNMNMIKSRLESLGVKAPVVEAIHKPQYFREFLTNQQYPLHKITKERVCSFCSIGDPASFDQTLSSLELNIIRNFVFFDHYWYGKSDIERIVEYCRTQGIKKIITTDKDAVKLGRFNHLFTGEVQLFVLVVNIQITRGEDEFFNRINHIL